MDKARVIEFFRDQEGRDLALADVRAGLGDVAERTLRRWLSELVEDGALLRSGDRKGARYRWEPPESAIARRPEAASSNKPASLKFSTSNARLLAQVRAPIYTRAPVSYSEKWVSAYAPNRSFYLSPAQRKLLQTGKRPSVHQRAGTYIQKIYDRLLVDFSYNSARLEGNTYTVADTERLVLQGIGAEGKLDAERIMILNHKEAIRYLVQNVDELSLRDETVRTLHYLLADSLVAPGLAGQIREDSIRISGSTYAPLEGRERLSRILTGVLKKARQIKDPFEQSFFVLTQLSYLQAFVDVNKRTARLACIIPLITQDFVPQSFIDVDKDDYLSATISVYELKEVGPLAELYCWSYLRTCQHYDAGAEAVGFDEIAARYRSQRRGMVAEIVKARVSPSAEREYVRRHMPKDIARAHRQKFLADVLSELEHLDAARVAGMGITKAELEAWESMRGR
jgi:Fic family protein